MESSYMQPMPMLSIPSQNQNMSRQNTTFQPPLTPKTPMGSVRTPRTPSSVQPQRSPANFPTPAPRTPRTPRGTMSMDGLVSPSPSTSILTPQPTSGKQLQQLHSVQSSIAPSVLSDDCRASAVYVNLMLSDSMLNLFRDHSFDQCALCVCNNNIRSRDVDLGYLPSFTDSAPQYICQCGFRWVGCHCMCFFILFICGFFDFFGSHCRVKSMTLPDNGQSWRLDNHHNSLKIKIIKYFAF